MGEGHPNIGHGSPSFTSDIRSVKTIHPINEYPVVFIDTPGFDDTYRSDIEIMSMIAGWQKGKHGMGDKVPATAESILATNQTSSWQVSSIYIAFLTIRWPEHH
jgi:hypothetical protein